MKAVTKRKRRRLISVTTYAHGEGEGQTYSASVELPMHSANRTESENAAVRIMQAVNAQLDFAGSDMRLVAFDMKEQKWLKVTIPA